MGNKREYRLGNLLVLGASSDIGLALIEQIHGNYDRVIAHFHRSEGGLKALRDKIGDRLVLVQADFSDEAETDGFAELISTKFENIAHIVHLPAGRITYARFPKKSWDSTQRDLDIQVRSIYKILSRLITPMTKMEHGKIVFVLSSCTAEPPKFLVDYTTAKFALLGFMKTLAAEYAEKGVNINAVSPSMMETKFLANIPHLIIEESAKANPAKRNAGVPDILPMIEFLLSNGSDFITGQNILVSGGGM